MNFEFIHSLNVDLASAERALVDPRLAERLEQGVSGYKRVRELERVEEGPRLKRRMQFEANAEIPSFARSKITPDMLDWIEESTYDRERHEMQFAFTPPMPDRWRGRFSVAGTQRLEAQGGATRWVVRGDLTIKVSLIGGLAERFVVGQFKKNYEEQAAVLRALAAG